MARKLNGKMSMLLMNRTIKRWFRTTSHPSRKITTSTTTVQSFRTTMPRICTAKASMLTAKISQSTNSCQNHIDARWQRNFLSSFLSTVIRLQISRSQPVDFCTLVIIFTVGWQQRSTSAHWWRTLTRACPTIPSWNSVKMVRILFEICENLCDNCEITEKSFHVFWERVKLQNKPDVGNFTFSASLYSNGDIVFGYYFLPIDITQIEDGKIMKNLKKLWKIGRKLQENDF